MLPLPTAEVMHSCVRLEKCEEVIPQFQRPLLACKNSGFSIFRLPLSQLNFVVSRDLPPILDTDTSHLVLLNSVRRFASGCASVAISLQFSRVRRYRARHRRELLSRDAGNVLRAEHAIRGALVACVPRFEFHI